jgi:molybdenum cofactor cytidylyltransferase
MSDIACIVLAAGLSRRMGEANKLLLQFDDDFLLSRVVTACAAVSHHPVTVVTGHQGAAVTYALGNAPVNFVHNSAFEEGQMTSVDAGLRGAPEAKNYLVALGDQPMITPDCLITLLTAHHANADGRITVPMVDGARGNPIVLPAAQRALMLADPFNLGCRKLTRNSPELVYQFTTANPNFIADIDTPEDLALARSNRLSQRSVAHKQH